MFEDVLQVLDTLPRIASLQFRIGGLATSNARLLEEKGVLGQKFFRLRSEYQAKFERLEGELKAKNAYIGQLEEQLEERLDAAGRMLIGGP
jgi:hypothetical protein